VEVISPKLALAIGVFVAGLLGLLIAVPLAVVVLRRRQTTLSDDYAVRLLRNSAVPFALQIIVRAIDMAFIAILFRVLVAQSLTDYNFAALVTTLILGTIAEWGLNIYLTREVARDPSAIPRMFGTTLIVRLIFATLVIPASLLIVLGYNQLAAAELINNRIEREGFVLMVLLSCTLLPGAFSAAVTALFMATERPIVPAVVGLLTNIVSALLKIAALLLGLGVVGVAGAALAATIASMVLFAVLLVRSFGWPGLRFDGRLMRIMLVSGFPLMLNGLLLAVFFRFDMMIIRAFRAAAEFNAYEAAYKYVGLTQILPPIVINAVFPLFARQAATDRVALRRAYSYLIRLLLLLALPIAAGISVLSDVCILILGGSQYIPLGAPALALLIWYLPLSYVNGVTQYVLIALDRPKTITWAFGAAAIFNLSFNLLFVPRYGINAAAIGTVFSEIVLYIPLWRRLRVELDPPGLLHGMWRPLLATFGMASMMLVARQGHVLVSVLAGPIVFWALLVMLRAIHEDDRRLARRVLRRA